MPSVGSLVDDNGRSGQRTLFNHISATTTYTATTSRHTQDTQIIDPGIDEACPLLNNVSTTRSQCQLLHCGSSPYERLHWDLRRRLISQTVKQQLQIPLLILQQEQLLLLLLLLLVLLLLQQQLVVLQLLQCLNMPSTE